MNDITHIIPVTVKDSVFDSLHSLEKNFHYPSSAILSMLIAEIFDKYPLNGVQKKSFICRSLRKNIHIPCVLKFVHEEKNITFKSGCIVDISLGGVGIAIREDVYRNGGDVYNVNAFELIAQMEQKSMPSHFTCRSCYVLTDPSVKLGGALLQPDMVSFRSFLRVFMRASLERAA